jgi:hypothetical protein
MIVEIKSVEVIVNPEFKAAEIIITPIFSSGDAPVVDVPIETISANGVSLPIVDKNVDVTIPTKTSDLTKDDVYTKSETYTQTEINNKLSAVYKFKGSVLTYDLLPTDAQNADVWNVTNGEVPELNGMNYAWNSDLSVWDELGGIIGIATLTENGLLSKEDFAALAALKIHTHAGQVINPEGIKLDTVNPLVVANAGEIGWNATDGTVDLHLLNGTKLQVGQELHIYGKASEAINNRDVIQFAGVQGDHILIKKAVQSEISVNPTLVMGIATQNIASGSFGYVTWFGKINDVFTTGFSLSDMLYFDSSGVVAGAITNVAPTAPNRKILLATVIKLQTGASENGIIMVRPTFGTKLADLDDVDGTDTTIADTDEVLKRDTEGLWKKVTWASVKTLLGGIFAKLSGGNTFADTQNFDGKINHKSGEYFYTAVSKTADTVNDTRVINSAGVEIHSICTVANVTKGGGTWIKMFLIKKVGAETFVSYFNSSADAVEYQLISGASSVTKIYGGNAVAIKTNTNGNAIVPSMLLVGTETRDTVLLNLAGDCNLNGYTYKNNGVHTGDTINDIRTFNNAGVFTIQKCTVGSTTKGGGTWVTTFTA